MCGVTTTVTPGEALRAQSGTEAATTSAVDAAVKRVVEFTHRATSGIALLLTIGLYVWSRRLFAVGHAVRRAAGWSIVFTVISALIGAILVLFSYVVHDKSLGRAITMPLHLINTFLMLGSMSLAAVWAARPLADGRKLFGSDAPSLTLKFAFAGVFALGVTGAVSAMGKTAFTSEFAQRTDLAERLAMHFEPGAHPILRGGIVHPLLATSIALFVLWACHFVAHRRVSPDVRAWANTAAGLFIGQMVFGVVNLLMSAPVAMQLGHLALALANWISLVMLAVACAQVRPVEEDGAAPAEAIPAGDWRQTIRDYVALTKPRIISLLLFTTLAAMFIAARGWPGLWLLIAVAIGGYMAAGAANAFNMVIERDLDVAMERTASRPTVTQRITNGQALTFAVALAVGSFGLLTWAANVLTAAMALCGLLFYVLIYTLLLKRRTWQNIVIGGAAGAFPPLVGYAAVTNELNSLAWFLFGLIFVWTPVHFWALAILIKDDYAKAGVPMLPVIHGDRVTVIQIALYAVLTALLSIVPLLQGHVGWIFLVGSGLLNAGLLAQSFRLLRHTDRPHAKALFKYSMVYLAAIFVVIAVDRTGLG